MTETDKIIEDGIRRILQELNNCCYDTQDDDKEFEELLKGLQIDLDGQLELFPVIDDDEGEVTKEIEVCQHPKKELKRFKTFEYWYCPKCKKEVKK